MPQEWQQKLRDERVPKTDVAPRLGEPEDIADIVGFLVSEKARWTTGSVICANGGAAKVF
jgi:3-oxoacyl-[acyl-carrier protein] reductase